MNARKSSIMHFVPQSLFGKRRGFLPILCFCYVLLVGRTAIGEPFIDQQPVSQIAEPGQTVVFEVKAGQTEPTSSMSVLWRRNGKNVPGSITVFHNVSGIVTASLTIDDAESASAGGTYRAIIYDAKGIAHSQPATLSFQGLEVLPVSNEFSNRVQISSSSGEGKANNKNAVHDPDAPRNGGIPGGKMVWIDWTSPDSGIVSLSTKGSFFDTTLGIYKMSSGGSTVSDLIPVTADDDSGNFYNSAVRFNATGGETFTIGIDGYYGDSGQIMLHWNFLSTQEKMPEILIQPKSQTVLPSESVTLFVDAIHSNTSSLTYEWSFNGTVLTGETNSNLHLTQVNETNVGQYRVKVGLDQFDDTYSVLSKPAQIQINTEGNRDALAGNKLHSTADTIPYENSPTSPGVALNALIAANPPSAMMTPVSGYTGTQIFSTYSSSHEPGEPDHCGQVGGSSTWFSYLAPDTGLLTVGADTDYEAVLAAYVWPGGSNYTDLVRVGCSNTNSGPGVESASFAVTNGTTYYFVVDGANGGYGTVTLSYELSTPPQISSPPQSHTVPSGSNALVSVTASGTPDPAYQWRMDQSTMTGSTNASLTIVRFSSSDEGSYDVVVSTPAGVITSSAASLYLADPLRIQDHTAFSPTGFSMVVMGNAKSNYVLQSNSNLMNTNWMPITTNSSPYGIVEFGVTNGLTNQKFYRIKSQ